jgi:hypothetical protein
MYRVRAAGDQQAVVGQALAAGEFHLLCLRVDLDHLALDQVDALPGVVVVGFAQMRAAVGDFPDQEIGDRHARIRRFGLVADEGDLGIRLQVAQGFGCHEAGRTITDDDVFHVGGFLKQQRQGAGDTDGLGARVANYRPSRARVSLVGTPLASQPRAL